MPSNSGISSVGSVIDQINVTIGPQFLNLFSEQLYSSPNKAFEELVANSWDAGATSIFISVPEDLSKESIVWVLDNGESMNIEGFQWLWNVAQSPKGTKSERNGRLQIGKFGIGKLATYVLANELTYICRADDGIIRAVTMDYRRIDNPPNGEGKLHIDPIPLDVRELTIVEVKQLLEGLADGEDIIELIDANVKSPDDGSEWQNDYGGDDPPAPEESETWTLALLSDLKPAGLTIQVGWIRRLLMTALPLGSSISINLNSDLLESTKIEKEVMIEWVIGSDLAIDSIEIPDYVVESGERVTGQTRQVHAYHDPYPRLEIEGFDGEITGSIKIFAERISGGKSEAIGHSNGFFINILGRVINPQDPYFGLELLNHAVWSRFRATLRCDNLNNLLSVNRNELKQVEELFVFRAFMRAAFNKARSEYDKLTRASWPGVGEILTDKWASVPLQPLIRLIEDRSRSKTGLPSVIISPTEDVFPEVLSKWQKRAKDEPGSLIDNVEFSSDIPNDQPLVKYDLAARKLLINLNHPFALENSDSRSNQEFLRGVALVDFLTETFMLESGLDDQKVYEIQEYKDLLLRILAQLSRKSGVQIAQLLHSASTDPDYEALERISGDALEYIGYSVKRLGNPGEPEGIAYAPVPASPSSGPFELDHQETYSFNYDAKSSKSGKAKTGNLTISGVKRHREANEAEYSLIIAPGYQVAEKLLEECDQNSITPIRASDLGKIVMLTASYGPIPMKKLETIFSLRNPDDVSIWIDSLHQELKEGEYNQRLITLKLLVQALDELGYKSPNAIHVSLIAQKISDLTKGDIHPSNADITSLIVALEVMMPSLIRLVRPTLNVIVGTSPSLLLDTLASQIQGVPEGYRFEIERLLTDPNKTK